MCIRYGFEAVTVTLAEEQVDDNIDTGMTHCDTPKSVDGIISNNMLNDADQSVRRRHHYAMDIGESIVAINNLSDSGSLSH